MRRRPQLGIAATLVLCATAVAQEPAGSIRGVVLDKDFDAPLPVAQVLMVETGQKVTTTDQGNFVFGQVPPGRYTLVFSKDGYVRQSKELVVTAGKLSDVTVALAGDFTEMEEFVVQDVGQLGGSSEAGLLQLRYASPALMDSIGAELMSKAGASDAASALRLVAGATVKDGKSAVIRGLPDRYVSSQLNGVRLPTADEDKRAVELDQFPAAVVESIQVSKTFTPDQQGDASGGAVDVRLRSVPDEPFFVKVKGQYGYNSQVRGRSDFLTYDGGGLNALGKDDGGRSIQYGKIGDDWDGAVGVSRGDAPIDYKGSGAIGGKYDLGDGVKIGGYGSLFYERDSSFYDGGVDNSYWVEKPGSPMTPMTFQGTAQDGDFKTALYDVTQAEQSVKWGGLGTVGLETEHNRIGVSYLYTRTAEDRATLAEDTRGKQYYFPGYDPANPSTPGHTESDAAPYVRLETLDYKERTTDSLQFSGRHELPVEQVGIFGAPEFTWTYAHSTASLDEPDKRQFGTVWLPGRSAGGIDIPATHRQYKPSANFTLGNLQRIWKDIEETSDQYSMNLKLPFEQWSKDKGYLKFGIFHDQVDRRFNQDTFSNFNDNTSYAGGYGDLWSRHFASESHPITGATTDVDYDGDQEIRAWYAMLDLPLSSALRLVGGARVESTHIGIVNHAEDDATWYPPGATAPTKLNPGDADVIYDQDDVLPSIGLEFKPVDGVTLRASYNETVARQTFKELTPILQQEFLGGPIFIGNPELRMSAVRSYDLRMDYTPYEGSLLSVSWFRKDIDDPIEYVQRIVSFNYTTATNYPTGELEGYELEVRHGLGSFWDALDGLSIGANATFIQSEVTLPGDEAAAFEEPGIRAPMPTRDMTDAPDHLYNFYLTYDVPSFGTQAAVFYTVQGDALIAGAGESNGNYVPNVYATEYGTLNLSLTQKLGRFFVLQFQAKNLTNPDIETVYRSVYIGDDVSRTSYTKGIDYTVSLGAEFRF